MLVNIQKGILGEIPNSLRIRCIKIPIELINEGAKGKISISKCTRVVKGLQCPDAKLSDQKILNLKLWAFTKAYGGDFAKIKNRDIKYAAIPLNLHPNISQLHNLKIRDVQINKKRGVV